MSFLKKKIPLYIVLSLLFPSTIFAYFILYEINEKKYSAEVSDTNSFCSYNISRLGGYKYIQPLMFAEPACESPSLEPVKTEIENLINSYKVAGTINSASVYIRIFHGAEWTSIEDGKKYSPGSLLKVPELITFYKMNEKEPGLLDKKILFDRPIASVKTATYLSKSIQLGHSYTIRELLHYMIANSDNNATLLLNQNIDVTTFKKIFTDLGLVAPDWNANEYSISARDYSMFMKILYNAGYLSMKDSELCTELLSECDFKEGMVAGLPPNCMIAHKFGEGGFDNSPQLSESGIVYCTNRPYILTVMTNGTDMKKLPQVISSISKAVYEKLSQRL